MDVFWLAPLFSSTVLVILFEMGDKSQLLAMAFAAKYKFWKVLAGIFIATIINHILAVAVGSLIGNSYFIRQYIQIISSALFVILGVWALADDDMSAQEKKGLERWGVIATITVVFFLAEMGDKTQIATINLAAKYPENPIQILMGTTIGMIIADGIGIGFGAFINKKLPINVIKIIASITFITIGIIGIYKALIYDFGLNSIITLVICFIITVISAISGYMLYNKCKK